MHCDDVGTTIEEGLRSLALNGRVEPGAGPVDGDGGVRVDLAHTEGEGVDAADHLRNGERSHVADLVGLRRCAGGKAGEIASLVDPAEVIAEVGVVAEVASRVEEIDVGELSRQGFHRVHVAEGSRKHGVSAVSDEVSNRLLEFGAALGNVFDRQQARSSRLSSLLGTAVVGPGPACVPRIGQVHERSGHVARIDVAGGVVRLDRVSGTPAALTARVGF